MKHKIKILLSFLVVALLTISVPASAATTEQSILIPGYSYPLTWTTDPYWNTITAAGGNNVPIVVINPNNGPGTALNTDYDTQMNSNNAAGIKQIGYVHTLWQARPQAEVFNDIDTWYSLYPHVSGIFLDEVATTPDTICYLSQTFNYVKSRGANNLVVANPGVHVTDAMAPYADIFATFEGSGTTYLNSYTPPSSAFELDPANSNRIMHIIYDVAPTDLAAVVAAARDRNAGWVFITDDVMPNPYDVLPGFFNDLVADVTSLPATAIPVRSAQPPIDGCVDPHAFVAQPPADDTDDSTAPTDTNNPDQSSNTPDRLSDTGDPLTIALTGAIALIAAGAWMIRRFNR